MDVHLQHPRVRPPASKPDPVRGIGFSIPESGPACTQGSGCEALSIPNWYLQCSAKNIETLREITCTAHKNWSISREALLDPLHKTTSSASSILMCSLLGPILLILGFFMKMKICRAEVCEPSMLMSAGVIANASPGLSIPKKATRMQKATSGQSQCNAKVTKARNTCSGMGQCEWLDEAAFQDQARSQAKGKCPRSSSAMSVTALSVSEKLSRERWASQEWKPKSRSNRSICLGSRQRKALNVMFL